MAYVLHRTPCCRSIWESKHNKGGSENPPLPFFMKIIYLGDGNNPINFLVKTINAFGDTYSLDESSINKMTLDGVEIKFEDLILSNLGLYGGTYDVYQYNFEDNSEHELIIYSDNLDTLRFSPWYGGPPTSSSHYFKNITKIEISNSVTNIGGLAFYSCTNLSLITIPNSVTSIGDEAFRSCTSLTSVEIPNSVTSIGNSAFDDCTSLTSVEIPNSVTSIGNSAFRGCSSLTSVSIPNSVTSIGTSAFNGCSGLTSAEIPNSVTSIGDGTFLNCSSLTSVTIPNSVTSIGGSAFSRCSGLTEVNIGNSVTSIGGAMCSNCTNLEVVMVLPTTPPSITNSYYGALFANTSENLVIYVPAESVDAYKAAEGWSTYADRIQAIP